MFNIPIKSSSLPLKSRYNIIHVIVLYILYTTTLLFDCSQNDSYRFYRFYFIIVHADHNIIIQTNISKYSIVKNITFTVSTRNIIGRVQQ